MQYWILKTEPDTYSFDNLVKDKKTSWSGVRNYMARNNIRAMKSEDLAVIYHSGDSKSAVGLAKISSAPYQELKTDKNWFAVDIVPVKPFKKFVTLAAMKADKGLSQMKLVKMSRLSVSPLTEKEYEKLIELSGL